jgi:hypothetical protein
MKSQDNHPVRGRDQELQNSHPSQLIEKLFAITKTCARIYL